MFFRSDEVKGDIDGLPDGRYKVGIVGTDYLVKHSGDVEQLIVQFKVIDGEHANRMYWEYINLVHIKSPKAAEIGKQNLKKLCKAVGKPDLERHGDLVGSRLYITIKTKDDWTNIKRFEAIDQVKEPVAPPPAASRPSPAVNFADDDIPF